ncbi:MAG TPA: DNA-binding protein WhiA [Candidatus Binatia bacterium]|nr:DNA-binding protein WhiA [Candidatus Binatia bacterium]
MTTRPEAGTARRVHMARPAGGSFTGRILAELAQEPPARPCCRRSLVEGMRLAGEEGDLVTTRLVAARAALAALHADGVPASVERLATPRRHRYRVTVRPAGATVAPSPRPFSALAATGPPAPTAGLTSAPPAVRAAARGVPASEPRLSDPGAPTHGPCCVRSRLRGLLLAGGSLGRGDGPAQLELRLGSQASAAAAISDLARLGVSAALVRRGNRLAVVVRSAPGVATLLSSLGAHRGRLEFEAGRVVGEVRSAVNRRLNAETANLRRTVAAAVAQMEAIERLRREPRRWDALPPALREAASLRARRPRASLQVLAAAAGCSRPAMAGRLHRLVAAARAVDEVWA